mgnify:CR=1 FL=1|jgi:rod shape-determining protein MreD
MSLNRIPIVASIFFFIFLIQEAFINRINFAIGGFTLYLAFFVAWIINEGRGAALIIGFIAGLIADLSPTLEAPFGLWTFVLTAMGYLFSVNLKGTLDLMDSPLTRTMWTVLGTSAALISFALCGAILGNQFGTLGSIFRELLGNAFWTFILSPLFIPATRGLQRLSLTARDR